MKKIITIIFALAIILGCQSKEQKQESATLHISLSNFKQAGASLIPDGQLKLIANYGEVPLELDENGFAHITINLKKPEYFMLSRNPLYISPGDELTIDLRDNTLETVFNPESKGYHANEYLKKRYYSKGGSFLEAGEQLRDTPLEMVALLDTLAAGRLKQLESLIGVSDEFRELEQIRIKADYVNSLRAYTLYKKDFFAENMSKQERSQHLNDYYTSLKDYIQPILDELSSNDKYLDIEVVRLVLSYFMENKIFNFEKSERFNTLIDVAKQTNNISANITLQEYEDLKSYGEQIPYEDIKAIYINKLEANSKLLEGQPAIDVLLSSISGEKTKLSELGKGEVMYIDVWATWCGPCKAESPYFEELSKQYPSIKFIAISVDSNVKAWQEYIKNASVETITQVLTDDEMRRNWDIGGIPRFILIDDEFRIISANAPRPSEHEKITEQLNKFSKVK